MKVGYLIVSFLLSHTAERCQALSMSSSANSSGNSKLKVSSEQPFIVSSAKTSGEDGLLFNKNTNSRRAFVLGGFGAAMTTTAGLLLEPKSAFAANLPTTGKKAPDFELPNSRGDGATSLSTLTQDETKWTVLYFYPGAFTSGCTLEARGFQKDADKYKTLNAQIVGVSVDSVEKNSQFCKEENLDFFMLSDETGKVSKAYGTALSIPGFGTFSNRQTYILDPTGNLRWVFTDVESHISRHSTEVLEKLQELQA